MRKRILSLLLVLVLLFALCAPVLADTAPEKIPFKYVSLGASNTLGYGLHGYWPLPLYDDPYSAFRDSEDENLMIARDGYLTSGYYFYSDDAYPVLVRDALQQRLGDNYDVTLKQCAINSMRAYDLRLIVDENWPHDGYYEWRLGENGEDGTNGWKFDMERERHQVIHVDGWDDIVIDKEQTDLFEEIRDALKTADFITYDLGINDFGTYVNGVLFGNPAMTCDMDLVLGEYADLYNAAKKTIEGFFKTITGSSMSLPGLDIPYLVDHLLYAYLGFIESFDGAMKYIYENNPDVEVVVCSIGNVFEGATLTLKDINIPTGEDSALDLGDITIPLGDMMGMMIDLANGYTSLLSPYHDKYYYADCTENGHVEYFSESMLAWDESTPDTLEPCVVDAFCGYDWHYITPHITDITIADYGGSIFDNYNGTFGRTEDHSYYWADYGTDFNFLYSVNPADKGSDDYEMVEKRSNDAQVYALAYFCKKALEHPDMRVNSFVDLGIDFIAPLTQILFYGYKGCYGADGLALWTNMSMDQIYALEREWIDDLLSTDSARAAAYFYVYAQISSAFFCHPSYEGHQQMRDLVMKAYDQNISGKRAANGVVVNTAKEVAADAVKLGVNVASKVNDSLKAATTKTADALGLGDQLNAITGAFSKVVSVVEKAHSAFFPKLSFR